MKKLTRLTTGRKEALIQMGKHLEEEQAIVEGLRKTVAMLHAEPSPQLREMVDALKDKLARKKKQNRRYFTKNILI